MMTSAPHFTASSAPWTLPTCAHWRMPACFSRCAHRASGGVQYQTTKSTFSSMRTSTWASVIDQVAFRPLLPLSPGAPAVVSKKGK